MKITILTLFPEMFRGPFSESIVKRAVEKKLVEIKFINIRDFGIGRHKLVDDTPYGGGKGMILRVDVLEKAIERAKNYSKGKEWVVLLSPQGKTFNQSTAKRFSKFKHLILICGHYEGVDARIESFIDEKISVGDFIVTGGEIPAMLIIDSTIRLVNGVLKKEATSVESFSELLEYPQYTKPSSFRVGKKNLSVPQVLLSGNHKKIEEYRKKEAEKLTMRLRPDLLKEKMQKGKPAE